MAFLLRTAPRSETRMLALMRERNHQRVAELGASREMVVSLPAFGNQALTV